MAVLFTFLNQQQSKVKIEGWYTLCDADGKELSTRYNLCIDNAKTPTAVSGQQLATLEPLSLKSWVIPISSDKLYRVDYTAYYSDKGREIPKSGLLEFKGKLCSNIYSTIDTYNELTDTYIKGSYGAFDYDRANKLDFGFSGMVSYSGQILVRGSYTIQKIDSGKTSGTYDLWTGQPVGSFDRKAKQVEMKIENGRVTLPLFCPYGTKIVSMSLEVSTAYKSFSSQTSSSANFVHTSKNINSSSVTSSIVSSQSNSSQTTVGCSQSVVEISMDDAVATMSQVISRNKVPLESTSDAVNFTWKSTDAIQSLENVDLKLTFNMSNGMFEWVTMEKVQPTIEIKPKEEPKSKDSNPKVNDGADNNQPSTTFKNIKGLLMSHQNLLAQCQIVDIPSLLLRCFTKEKRAEV
ncbi:MAG: hypothetical protein Q4D14_06075, partial [Bacteroidales bacterium]|nr:hypothetical protein [Bacteroidales bacterium]